MIQEYFRRKSITGLVKRIQEHPRKSKRKGILFATHHVSFMEKSTGWKEIPKQTLLINLSLRYADEEDPIEKEAILRDIEENTSLEFMDEPFEGLREFVRFEQEWGELHHILMSTSRLEGKEEEARESRVLLASDVFGPPEAITINKAHLCANDNAATRIAQMIYEEQCFGQLPILADALEDAGCDNADILNHLRQSGSHIRGCWALDLVLGKE